MSVIGMVGGILLTLVVLSLFIFGGEQPVIYASGYLILGFMVMLVGGYVSYRSWPRVEGGLRSNGIGGMKGSKELVGIGPDGTKYYKDKRGEASIEK